VSLTVVGDLTTSLAGCKSLACNRRLAARTLFANFYNAVFLIIYLVIATPLIT